MFGMSESPTSLQPEDLRQYANRDWARVRAAKAGRWQRCRESAGGAEGNRLGAALYKHARDTRADWPSPQSRQEDLAHHLALKKLLDAFAHSQATS